MDAVLLLNLGSPDEPSVPAVRRYLREFLGDRHVITLPWILRKILLECIILPRRPKRSAALYRKIWTQEGSPLIVQTERLRSRVAEFSEGVPVLCAMRYGNPSVEKAARELSAVGVRSVRVIPLYPQRAASSWGTAVEKTQQVFSKVAPQITLHFAKPFFDHPDYIAALAEHARVFLGEKSFDKILISFHGVPVATATAQSYREECETTARLLAQALDLGNEQWEVVFQSRFGRGKWLEPSTETRLRELPGEGVKNLVVIAPGFIADCLETLEELAVRGKKTFLDSGGTTFALAPCLNDDPALARFLSKE